MSGEKHAAPYLASARIDRFGSMAHRSIGPFSPHLNIVLGHNEAGKTTFASFVGGVLFGWEDARGRRNTYKPEGAERAGSLFFAEREGVAADEAVDEGASAAPLLELRRVRNADGLQGAVELVDDIDKDTFRTMFSLNSDELLSLRNTADVTAHLLTAGSGTGCSPAQALASIQEKIASYTSRAASAEQSLTRLASAHEEVRRKLAQAADEAERYRGQARELHELEPRREAMNAQVEHAHSQMESLSACRAGLEKLDGEAATLEVELAQAREEEQLARGERRVRERRIGQRLAELSPAEDRAMRDKLEALSEQQARREHALNDAREDSNASQAAFEAGEEAYASAGERSATGLRRAMQVGVTVVLFALLIVVGVPLFMQGRVAGSLSYTSLGLVMVVFGLVLAAAALVLMFCPNKRDEARRSDLQQAQQAMLQDKKRLEACERDVAALERTIEESLAEMGLAVAGASPRRARALLDEAKDVRAEMALDCQREQAVAQRARDRATRLAGIAAQREALCERAGMSKDAALAEVDAAMSRCSRQRAELSEACDALNRRWGELTQELAQAQQLHEFDRLKNADADLNTRKAEAARNFARHLLAARMLEDAIAAWESKSQPEVYAQASRLLRDMTQGRWTRVMFTDEGDLRVTDAVQATYDPLHLSLGTCQQLYLALRIALLTCADNVGKAIPVLADDILVNFDAARRAGAARALAALARTRQVIVLTCHEDVARVLEEAAQESGRPATVVHL